MLVNDAGETNLESVNHAPLVLIKTNIQYSATHTGHARSVPEPMPAASRMRRLGKVVLESKHKISSVEAFSFQSSTVIYLGM